MMNRFFTLLLAASCLTAVGQEECTDISSTFNFSALYLEADYYAADSIHYFYVRFYPNGMGEYWQLNSYSIFGILSFEYSLCEQNGEIFYTDSWLYEAQVNPSGVFEGTTNLGYPFTYTPVRGGSPFETETNSCGWQPDGNGDNLIGVNDLLDLLGVYGDTDYDQDGIWDSADDCVGEYDECGVCNGGGPSIPIIESIEILYDSVYAEQIDEWWVFEVGADTTFQYVCGLGCTDPLAENYDESVDTDDGSCVYPWACGDPLEYQGYDYETVQIGEQCWFAENLRSLNYLNGDAIPHSLPRLTFSSANYGAACIYGDTSPCENGLACCGGQTCNPAINEELYGYLYNGHAITDIRGLCPQNWHISSQPDWLQLLDFVSSLPVSNSVCTGKTLSSEEHYVDSWNGTDLVGFNGLPGGSRDGQGNYVDAGEQAHFWTSENTVPRTYFKWGGSGCGTYDGSAYNNQARSIRCIKDAD